MHLPSIVIHKTWTPTADDLIVSALDWDALGLVPSTSLQSAAESSETVTSTKQEEKASRLHYFGHQGTAEFRPKEAPTFSTDLCSDSRASGKNRARPAHHCSILC